jgi:hypothetical protein
MFETHPDFPNPIPYPPFSYRKIYALIKEEHNLSISFDSVKRILEDVVRIKREDRNRKRRKLVA